MKKSVHFLKKIVLYFLLLGLALQPAISQVYAVTEKQLTELELSSKTQEEQLEILQKQLKEAEKSLKTSESNRFKSNVKVGIVSFSVGAAAGVGASIYIYNMLKN